MTIDKDELKNSLTIEQIFNLVEDLGGEPKWIQSEESFSAHTICHNKACCGSHKLFYYNNTHLFKCYTECNNSFDIYELVRKQKSINDNKIYGLPSAIGYVANYFGYEINHEEEYGHKLNDWNIFERYSKLEEKNIQQIQMKIYNNNILQYYPHPLIAPWIREGISKEVLDYNNICFNPVSCGIIIPHYNIENQLIGIRERTLIKEQESNGKYKPAIINGIMYNHPLGFNLYNLNNSKNNIHNIQKAIIFEGEKGSLLYQSYFGIENDISVAVCGNTLSSYQLNLLLQLGCKEVIIAFDKQFKECGDKEWEKWTSKLEQIKNKFGSLIQISFMFDKNNLLGYKDSPIDCQKDIFLQLFKERIFL